MVNLVYLVAILTDTGLKFNILILFPIIIYFVLLLNLLFPSLGIKKLDVILYTATIILLLWQAIERTQTNLLY